MDVQEAREDEEAGYARLEDIRSVQKSREKARYCFRIFSCFAYTLVTKPLNGRAFD